MKKILIITYYWPPLAGGGVQRWLKFAKYLPKHGWNPIIFTPEQPDFNLEDRGLNEDISPEIEVLRFPIWEPFGLYKKGDSKSIRHVQGVVLSSKQNLASRIKNWFRGNIILPDPKVFWVKPAVRFLTEFIQERGVEVIVTTGPPHSMHLIGLRLKRKLNIKWIADFRDPWSKWDMLANFSTGSLARKKLQNWESEVCTSADIVTTVSQSWANEFKSDHSRSIEVITNGYDVADFQNKEQIRNEEFLISHSGLINNFRDPSTFLQSIKELCSEDPDFNNKLKLEFCGVVDNSILERIKNDEILGPKFQFTGYQTHSEVIKLYSRSNVLLLLTNKSENNQGHLPGKLFEYFAANRFILALGSQSGDTSKLISETASGVVIDYDDKNEIKNAILKRFESSSQFQNNKDQVLKYTRDALTQRLVSLINQLV